jgi:AAA15 family ATPase/GTPase
MLRNIKVTNFYSIGETQEISFEINPKDILNDSAKTIMLADEAKSSISLNLVSCLIGANASGKTTLLKAISFLLWFTLHSYRSNSPKTPKVFHKLKKDKPTKIEIGFLDDSSLYNYVIEFDEKEILYEYLGKRVQRETCVFELTRKNGKTSIKSPKIKINETDKNRFEGMTCVPLLSSLMGTGYITYLSFFKKCITNVDGRGFMYSNSPFQDFLSTSGVLYGNESLLHEVLNFSQKVDLGISSFDFRAVISNLSSDSKEDKTWLLQGVHRSKKGSFNLDLIEESHGTQLSIYFLSKVSPILKNGGLAILDEIEIGLHTHIVRKIITLFEDKKTNPHNAQLIFSTHQHPLLTDRTKTQIFLAEKDDQKFETEIYRLDEVNGVRNDENYYQKYIAGAYGANPKINWL